MKAIVPAAGISKRLRPHTETTPKALLEVAGKPILAHILDELVSLGIDEVVLIVGYLGERIQTFARERYAGLRLHFVSQDEPLGNGHAVYVAREHLDSSPALIIFGDTIIKGELAGVLRSRRSLAGVTEVADPRWLGVVELGPDVNIRRIIEKPQDPAHESSSHWWLLHTKSSVVARGVGTTGGGEPPGTRKVLAVGRPPIDD